MKAIKEEWAREIMDQAIAEVKTKDDIERITKDIERTSIGLNEEYMKIWRKLIEMKDDAGLIK